jgi:hypothetical protein
VTGKFSWQKIWLNFQDCQDQDWETSNYSFIETFSGSLITNALEKDPNCKWQNLWDSTPDSGSPIYVTGGRMKGCPQLPSFHTNFQVLGIHELWKICQGVSQQGVSQCDHLSISTLVLYISVFCCPSLTTWTPSSFSSRKMIHISTLKLFSQAFLRK